MIRSIGSGELEHSTHPLSFSAWGIKPPTKFSKSGEGLDRILFFRRHCRERGSDLIQGGCSFYIKNKLKSEIFTI